ncbi:response regulator transcription factor [Flavitalea sp. BT771]|uniref:response regulator transcription factor n=1 Tax=Flavitalea sp. BT771 TaxID=3063329 RepID=UPI0026E14110|nr:response regulator transcription factor [Flavitalea sp. BT771]MDO6435560.1 response regulator transcription factor [Flavitalea sp. BT771]MDV6224460.1 response regulator transcription factor [Flavitalea sp. BT771]
MIRVFITDDHEMYLEGLALLLGRQEGIEVVGTAQSGKDLLSRLNDIQTDILLLDVYLPDMGEEELLQSIRASRQDLKIIYLTLLRGTRYIHKLTRHNIQGYVLKNATLDELLTALQAVQNGGSYFSKDINIGDRDEDFRNTITIEDKQIDEILSRRELEVLKLICREYSNAEIADKLFLSVSTVETHRKNLIAKLGVNNTVGLVKFALRNKLID